MLDSDMCLFYQDNRKHAKCMTEEHRGLTRNRKYCRRFERKGTFINAKKSSCCAWIQYNVPNNLTMLNDHKYCGMDEGEVMKYK